jgi:hypothetical protein
MGPFRSVTSPSAVGRRFLGAATIVSVVFGLAGDARWFAASAALGTAWWGWDLIWDNVIAPLGNWFTGMLTGTVTVEQPPDLSLDDTIRLLESHLAATASPQHVQIQSALRLAEIYQIARKDPARAREVIERVRARWPDAPQLKAYEKAMADGEARHDRTDERAS